MKKIAVLTGGGSLARDWSDGKRSDYALVFAVNRAGLLYECDFWGFLDEHMRGIVESGARVPKCGYLYNGSLDVLPNGKSLWEMGLYGARRDLLERRGIESFEAGACSYTFPCVLDVVAMMANQLRCEVDLYGFDCGGMGAGENVREYGYIRWRLELPWVAYAMPERLGEIYGDAPQTWKDWARKPEGVLPR